MKNLSRDNLSFAGILPVDKPSGITSFDLVRMLRSTLGIRKIGHAGTLDPFASGVMIMLLERQYTRMSDLFLSQDKEYIGTVHLGIETDSYDRDGDIVHTSSKVPSLQEVESAISHFQGEILQVPPMYSAKKVQGKKLYELARKGKTVERAPVSVKLRTEFLSYNFPRLDIRVICSKGTYIRSIAHDIGQHLGCGAHLSSLIRTRSGGFALDACLDGEKLRLGKYQPEEILDKISRPNENIFKPS